MRRRKGNTRGELRRVKERQLILVDVIVEERVQLRRTEFRRDVTGGGVWIRFRDLLIVLERPVILWSYRGDE